MVYDPISSCENFYYTMRDLWQYIRDNYDKSIFSFDDMMSSNNNRVDFISYVLELAQKDELSDDETFQKLVGNSYDFLIDYELGKLEEKQLTIPGSILSRIDDIRYIPSDKELSKLLDLISINNRNYNNNFLNRKMRIELPYDTFHRGIVEELQIDKDKLAHLLGITSSKSFLVGLFVYYDKKEHPEYYDSKGEIIDKENNGIAIRIVDFYSDGVGRDILLNLNNDILCFVEEDKMRYKDQYKADLIKEGNLNDFKKRFFDKFGFEFPLLEYNKMLVKNVSFLNYSNLSFVSEIVVDYNNPNSKSFKSDKFLVHYSNRNTYLKKISKYVNAKEKMLCAIKGVSSCPKEIKEKLLGKDKFLESKKKLIEILEPNYSRIFLDKYHIRDDSLEKELKKIDKEFDEVWGVSNYPGEVDILGFISDDLEREDMSLDESFVKTSKCETSQNKKVFDLVNNFYVNGRRYFIDKVFGISSKKEIDQVLKISTIPEEINFDKVQMLVNPDKKYKEDILDLEDKKSLLMSLKAEYRQHLEIRNGIHHTR